MALDKVVDLSAARGAKAAGGAAQPPRDADDKRPLIQLDAGELHSIVDAIDAALVAYGGGLYRQGGRLVTLVWEKIAIAGGGHGDTLRLSVVTVHHLLERISLAARFERYNAVVGVYVAASCPKDVAEAYLARDGRWGVPFILGVVTAPTLRPDGSVLCVPGYDEATCLVFNPLGVEFLGVPDAPSRAEAEAALALLREPIAGYPLDGAVLSVVLSAILTTVIRRALPTAPMHAFSASTAGSGKSMLVDIAAMIATGHPAAVTSTGRDKFGDAELEKRLTSSMLAGDAVLSIDNLEAPLGGELLCQLLTQTMVKLRPLGKSVNVEVPVTTSFFATGNNLTVVGDLTRRVLVGAFEVNSERPELRRFDFNPLAMARARRVELVQAVLIIIRAYLVALGNGDIGETPTVLGSYEEWSRLVREPLIWLGLDDPVGVLEAVRENDPRLGKLRDMVQAWGALFGDREVLLASVVDACMEQHPDEPQGAHGTWRNPELREAVMAVAAEGRGVNLNKLGWWLKKNGGRPVDGCRFKAVAGARRATWALDGGAGLMAAGGADIGLGVGMGGAEIEF